LATLLLLLLLATTARAASVRRVFEPTDMELETPGVMEVDMQYGVVRGETAYRVSSPDFEIDLGLTNDVELDLDGELAVGGPDNGDFTIDRWAPDNLWASIKVGLLDLVDADADTAWTMGLQLGPRIPLATGNQGVGAEGLLLVGRRIHKTQVVLNLGGLVDPAAGSGSPRPEALEGGLDLNLPLDRDGRWALTGELAGVGYLSPDKNQLSTTLGITWSPTSMLDLSVVVLRGWLSGGDQWGVLFGVSPKFRLW
jgi:hypothetical protein